MVYWQKGISMKQFKSFSKFHRAKVDNHRQKHKTEVNLSLKLRKCNNSTFILIQRNLV